MRTAQEHESVRARAVQTGCGFWHQSGYRLAMSPFDESQNISEEAVSSTQQMPRPKHVAFYPEYDRRAIQLNREAAENRLATLFGSMQVADPIEHKVAVDSSELPKGQFRGLGNIRHERVSPSPFKIVPSDFLAKARRNPPRQPQATASAFSSWVYSLYASAVGDDLDRERGKEIEQEVLDRRRNAAMCNDNKFLSGVHSNWALVHNGIEKSGDEAPKYLHIDRLHVRGSPLRASPDLMYYNGDLSKVVIVEIKHTSMLIPTNLWPNIWAQLWCYSQLDIPCEATTVSVVGEVWSDEWTKSHGRGRNHTPGERLIALRASVQRDPRAPAYDRFFRELFNIFSEA